MRMSRKMRLKLADEIKGYRRLSEDEIKQINQIKDGESMITTLIDILGHYPEYDQRWVAIGRTHIEQGFMALTRAVARPGKS